MFFQTNIQAPPLRYSLFVLLLLLCGTLAAQTKVTVVDAINRSPIEFVSVVNKDQSFSAQTDAKGEFTLPKSLSKTDTLFFIYVGYEDYAIEVIDLPTIRNMVALARGNFGLDTVQISDAANRSAQLLEEIAGKIDIVSAAEIELNNPQTSADLLTSTGGVHVQKSQMGGGSPVIRGFEANKVLVVVDGVRMNNAIFRSGHLQNVISIDPAVIEKTEVVYGPGSVMYGSDALGGVMHFFSKNPKLSPHDSITRFEGSSYVRYSSANLERSGHLDFSIGKKKWGFLTSGTINSFGDLRSGNLRNPLYPDWGKHETYVERINGTDSTLVNEDPNIQRHTGYDQYSFLQKVLFLPSDQRQWKLNFQYNSSSDVPRYDRYTQLRNGAHRYGRWDYGPQKRLFLGLSHLIEMGEEAKAFDQANFVLAYQKFDEDRIDRNYQSTLERHREEDVHAVTFNADLNKNFGLHSINYGAEYVYNYVQSKGYSIDLNTLAQQAVSARYPDGGTDVHSYAGYFKHNFKLTERWTFSESLRYTRNFLSSSFVDTSFFDFPFQEIFLTNDAISGSLGFVFNGPKGWHLHGSGSSGFRAPNLDDIAKIFDSNPGQVIVPNDDLSPENAFSVEIGVHKRFKDRFRIEGQFFVTSLQNAIVREKFLYNGQDSILYDGVLSEVQANTNSGEASLRGFHLGLDAKINKQLNVDFALSHTLGEDALTEDPLGHIPPMFGHLGLAFQTNRFQANATMRFAGWKRIEDYSPSGVDNQDESLAEGTPAWYTLNLKSAYSLNKSFKVQLGLENILDLNYREFGSGVSAPGRNLILSLHGYF